MEFVICNHGKILAEKQLFDTISDNQRFSWPYSADHDKTWTQFTPLAIDSAGMVMVFINIQKPASFKNQRCSY